MNALREELSRFHAEVEVNRRNLREEIVEVYQQLGNEITGILEKVEGREGRRLRSVENHGDRDHHSSSKLQSYIKASNVKFPKYDGGNDPKRWISKADHYFVFHHIPENERVVVAAYYLQDDALEWLWWFDNHNKSTSWGEALQQRFGPRGEDPMASLSKLRQNGTLEDYQTHFEKLLNKVVGIINKAIFSVS